MSVKPGTIVAFRRGGDFDAVTHQFVRTQDGYIRLDPTYKDKGVQFYDVAGAEQPAMAVESAYDSGSIVSPAPEPGKPITSPYGLLGLPDGTRLLSPTGKPMVKQGKGIVADGKLFEPRYVSDQCRIIESEEGVIGHGGNLLDRLHHMLTRAGVQDGEIINGPSLTEAGNQKVARALDIGVEEVPALVRALVAKLRDDQVRFDEMAEEFSTITEGPEERFTYEIDYLKNVTVTDSLHGKKCFVRGSQAIALLNRLKGGNTQQVLSAYEPMMESEEAPEAEASYVRVIEAAKKPKTIALDESFDEEIASSHGAYNFHWRLGRKHGFATARFRGRGKDMDIKVISVRDTDGETLELPDEQMEAIHEQAVLFIGEE